MRLQQSVNPSLSSFFVSSFSFFFHLGPLSFLKRFHSFSLTFFSFSSVQIPSKSPIHLFASQDSLKLPREPSLLMQPQPWFGGESTAMQHHNKIATTTTAVWLRLCSEAAVTHSQRRMVELVRRKDGFFRI